VFIKDLNKEEKEEEMGCCIGEERKKKWVRKKWLHQNEREKL
jgi:hypothetical protein